MEKYVEKHMPTFVVLTAFSFVATISLVFLYPDSEGTKIVARFQTLITGIFAAGAASFTAVVVYTSATIPVREQERQRERDRKEKEQIYAALMLQGLVDIMLTLGSYNGAITGEVPAILLNPEALETQNPEIAAEVSRVALMAKAYWSGSDRFSKSIFADDKTVVISAIEDVVEQLEPISGLKPEV
ncbi:hypothetical protein [Varunaivibrio sulfuroxidans]|uniref:hypothetical protein n=1 Tax=Varunaivibrio sulfuroxidans TaxID=1773489 RepID=UPI001044B661|nr:hypothetical protein [Varunaivibrio sulfuroxidans]WES31203.1 hypothetical protein P3M64_02160 [Varunaivibrio sulfuroxidans]